MESRKVNFFNAILALESQEECEKFLADLLTPEELSIIANRWQIFLLLHAGLTQREIVKRTKVSIATVSRANRSMKFGTGGCRLLAEKIQNLASKMLE